MHTLLLFFVSTASALVPRQTSASTTGALTCTPTIGPATEGIASAYCACGNGFTQPLAPSSDQVSYDPCPPTQMPAAMTTTAQAQWAFTTTQSGGITIECESASYMGIDGTTFPLCRGKTQTIQPSKSPSVKLDIANATTTYAGTLTGTPLSTAITSAIHKVCNTKGTAGGPTCTGTATIDSLPYPDDNSRGESEGELELIISEAKFTDADTMEKMIQAMGATFMQWSSHPDACKNLTYDVPEPRGGGEVAHKRLGCFVPGAVIAQYYSGHDVYGAEDVLWVEATFKGAPGSEDVDRQICADIMTAASFLESLFAMFFPPAAAADAGINDAIDVACDIAEDFAHATSAIGSL